MTKPTCSHDGCDEPVRCRGICARHYDRLRKRGPLPPLPKVTDAERLTANREVDANGCWIWTGPRSPSGYGRINHSYVHRISYELNVGPIPEGLHIDHLCRNPPCFNPEHLEPVTRHVNIQRAMWIDGKCRNRGHDVSIEGFVYYKDGSKTCRACVLERSRRRSRRSA